MQLDRLYAFPPKSLRNNKEFIQRRMEKLDEYFKEISLISSVSSSAAIMQYFLDYHSNQNLEAETKKSAEAVHELL